MIKKYKKASVTEAARAIVVDSEDNVATALVGLEPGKATLIGDIETVSIKVNEPIKAGHKIALCEISNEAPIIKYGTVIGWASKSIQSGQWVHLHNCRSGLDERSSTLDEQTGEPSDTLYE